MTLAGWPSSNRPRGMDVYARQDGHCFATIGESGSDRVEAAQQLTEVFYLWFDYILVVDGVF